MKGEMMDDATLRATIEEILVALKHQEKANNALLRWMKSAEKAIADLQEQAGRVKHV